LRNVKAWLGLALITAALFGLDKNVAFPGWYALLPTIGAALLISAGSAAWLNRAILAHPAMVGVGLISYPLYLWHWPLFSFARIIDGEAPSSAFAAALVLVSVVLAWATYHFIERPIRFGPRRSIKVAALCGMMVALGGVGIATYFAGGFPSRSSAKAYSPVVAAHDDWIHVEENFPQPLTDRIRPALMEFGFQHRLRRSARRDFAQRQFAGSAYAEHLRPVSRLRLSALSAKKPVWLP
jgi:hypothetical protein